MMSDFDSESESKGESQTESMQVPMTSESVYKRSSTGRKRVMTKERADKGFEGVRVMTKERKERADKGVQGGAGLPIVMPRCAIKNEKSWEHEP